MGRKARTKKESSTRDEAVAAATPRTQPDWLLLALAVIGLGLTGYISYTHSMGDALKGCTVGSSCDLVLSSRWAFLLGLPTSEWGFLAYLTLAGLAFLGQARRRWQLAWTVAFTGVLYSAYLTTVSLTIIGATCPYCLTSFALMTVTFILLTVRRPDDPSFSWGRWLRLRGAVAVVLLALLHLNYVGVLGDQPTGEDPVAHALATYLKATGAKMYGASWCPHCQEQKAMFGNSARLLPYIECSPGGPRAPQAEVCRQEKVNTYPTWVIKGERHAQVMTFSELAAAAGFDLTAATAAAAH